MPKQTQSYVNTFWEVAKLFIVDNKIIHRDI